MSLEERRRRAEEAARSRLRAERDDLERRATEPLAAGDLLWLPATAALPVEWAVVEIGAARSTLVPADTHPAAGAADVTVAGEPGPLTLRCGFAVRIAVEKLGEYRRTGRLPAPAIEAARQRLAAPAAPAVAGEAENDPEYGDWIAEAIQPARQALDPAGVAAAAPPQRVRQERVRRRSRGLELAASALLAAGAALAGSQIWHEGRIRELEAQRARGEEQLERRLGDLAGRAAAGDRASREAAMLRERLAAAERRNAAAPRPAAGAPVVEPLLNPRIEWFQPSSDALRGEERRVAVPPTAAAARVFFVLETWSPKPYARYRVALIGPRGAAPVWQSDGLVAQGSSEIVFGLPASHLTAGAHAFQLYGLGEEGAVALERFDFRVERPR